METDKNLTEIIDQKQGQETVQEKENIDPQHSHHDHDHKHDDEIGDEQKEGKKHNRNEKKFKKAMQKIGMKPVEGITRVTLKKSKAFILCIDDPEVLKAPGQDGTYVIFGEAKILDKEGISQDQAKQEAEKFKAKMPEPQVQQESSKIQENETQKLDENKKQEEQGENQNVEDDAKAHGLEEETIKMVMEHCKCTRQQAIKALKDSNGDSVTAILALTT